MTATMTRDKISMEAYKLGRALEAKARAAWNTAVEASLWGKAGEASRLANDACETGHTKKALMKRLVALRKEAA
jgi:hypothetical protein